MIPPRNKPTFIAASLLVTCALQGCFTGVESTKRITDSDVRRQHAAGITAEERFMADIAPVPPSKWKPGRRLRVDSDRIGLIFTSASDPADSLAGKDLFFRAFTPVR
ncbi:MAG: hypothetical protein K2F63_00885, partial [Muribaculaceae bacterium]|nr:hypothetical protein [Muribaculaceae bacterium]